MATPIRGTDMITTDAAIKAVLSASPTRVRGGDVSLYTATMVGLCRQFGLRSTVLVAQAWHETGGFSSAHWATALNPAGLGITGPSDTTPYKIENGADAAEMHVWSMLVALREWDDAARIILPDGTEGWVTRWTAKYRDPACPAVNDVEDLNQIYSVNRATWATDPQYDTKLLRVLQQLFPQENQPMSIPVSAPPLEIAITPKGSNRPELVMDSPSYITVHEVGNQQPGADEDMHKRFVHNGGGPNNVSFHFVVGPTKAIQLLPLDEAAWHASDGYYGPGNRDSIAIETIQIGDFDKTLWHLAWLINEIATNPDRFFHNQPRNWDMSIQRIVQHNYWAPDGKNCPQFIRDRGLWPELMRRVDLWHEASPPTGTGPKYAPAQMPEFLINDNGLRVEKIGSTPVYPINVVFTATRDTPRMQGAAPNKLEVGPPIEAGTRFRSTRAFRSRDKVWVLTKNGSRVAATDLKPIITISVDGYVGIQF